MKNFYKNCLPKSLRNLGVIFIVFLLAQINPTLGAPAYPNPIDYKLPDGTTITIRLMGDEKVKWAESTEGYSILINQDGFFEYAILDTDGNMESSGVRVSPQGQKSQQEIELLQKLPKGLRFSPEQVSIRQQIWEIKEDMAAKSFPTTGNRSAICILIGFTDVAFNKTQAEFYDLFNEIGYNTGGATGSFKDYYLENSYGQLDVTFDVAGPYTASQNMAYYGANDANGNDVRPRELVLEAINLADPHVDFSQYANGGTEVRGLYIIYAGYGEEAGGGANTIWAHAWALVSPVTRDGVTLWRYACSAELRSNSGSNISRIGVIAHEFGHTLGAPDYYDTNYGTGGQFSGTGSWDMMAGGTWNNGGATPAHHNGFTKTVVFGWAPLPVLNSPSTITLYNAAQNSNSFYRYDTTTPNEYFLLEKRQQVGFDANIPGNGMIVYHVHSDVFGGPFNSINATHPQRMYPVAQNATMDPTSTPSSYGTINAASCAWTGLGGTKTEFSDASLPSSKSWAGANTNKPITNILRNVANQTVTFDFMGGAPCTVPTNQATDFSASAIGDNQMTINWTRGNGDAVLVVARAGSAVNANPSIGTNYPANSMFSSGAQIGEGNYVVFSGDGSSVAVTNLLPATTYHYAIFEYNTTESCYLIPGLAGNATTTGTPPCTYCIPTASTDDNTGVTRVTFNTIDNTSTGDPAYTDFTHISTTVNVGDTYNLSVRVNTGGNYTVQTRAWIDWNQNCIFEAGEMYDLGTATNQTNGLTSLSPLSITVPVGALPGQTTMRVRTVWNQSGDPTPCNDQWYNEAEDYNLIVIDNLVWAGSSDTNWHNTGNWTPSRVPTAFDNVIIPAGLSNYPTLDSPGACRNILLGSNATSTATLLDNGNLTIHGTATVQRHIPRNGWHFLSAPVGGMDIIDSDFVPNGNPLPSNFDFFAWNETTPLINGNWYPWVNVRGAGGVPNVANFQQFVPGRGYLVAYAPTYSPVNPFSFEGSLQTGIIGVTVNHSSTSPAIQGWNLIGNPYPSAINWASADKTLFADNFAYIYDPTLGGGGAYHSEDGLIAPHQGFFVKKESPGTTTFNFTNAIRAHGGTYRKDETVQDRIRLKLIRPDNNFYDETTLRVIEGSLFERDSQDALKLFSFNPQMPQVFFQTADNVQVAINSFPEIPNGLEVMLGVLAPVSGNYKMELEETSGVFANTTIWLHDLQNGGAENISANPSKEYYIPSGTHQSYFKLTFAQPTNIGQVEEDAASIHTWENTLYISFTQNANHRQLRMFDISGRQVLLKEMGQGTSYTIPLNLQPGVYVVQVASPAGVVNQRVFVR